MTTIAALLFSGLSQPIMAPPLEWIYPHVISWVPAFWVFSRLTGRRALLAGCLVGTSANLGIYYWLAGTVQRFGGIPLPVAIWLPLLFAAAMGFYTAVFAWGFVRVRSAAGAAWPAAIAAWFCACEFLNPQLFAYLQGVGWYQFPRFFLLSALTGVSGVSFIVILCNAVVLQAVELLRSGGADAAAKRSWIANAALLAGLWVFALGYSSVRMAATDTAEQAAAAAGETLRVAVVQPNHTIERRNELRAMAPDAFAEDMIAASRDAIAVAAGESGRAIDVFVWPEGALRSEPSLPRNRAVVDFARETGAEIWLGATHHQDSGPAHNSAFRIRADGSIDRRYDKIVLMPFGEYMPLADVFPFLAVIPAVGDFEAGTEVPIYRAGPARFVFLICYEAIRGAFVREALGERDVNLLVNTTVDAWYGDGSEQSQHLMLVAVQAALHGIPVLRATTTGISAVIDARGVFVERAGNFTREAIVGDIAPLRMPSPYSRYGDWFGWLCVAASALLLLGSRRRPNAGAAGN